MESFKSIVFALLTLLIAPVSCGNVDRRAPDTKLSSEEKMVLKQIIRNKPEIKMAQAYRLTNVIMAVSEKRKVPANILAAILMQESRYKLDAKSIHFKRIKEDGIWVRVVVYRDFGIGQIHYKSIKRHKLDVKRLLNDLYYSVDAAALILKDMKKGHAKKEPNSWWVRYNCGTGGSVKRHSCKVYERKVRRYL